MRKKILILSPYFPYPPHDGGKVRMFNLIKHLSRLNDVYFLSYIEPSCTPDMVAGLAAHCRKVFTVVREEDKRIMQDGLPRSCSFFYTRAMIEKLESVVNEIQPDIVQIDFLIMTQYVQHLHGVPVVYTEHDISNINFEQSFHDRDLPEKERFVEWTKLVAFEKKILYAFRGVIALTERDRQIIGEFASGLRTVLVPTGTDIDYYRPAAVPHAGDSNYLLFIGHYRHYPNYDAVEYFINSILPSIVAKVPDVKFNVVGSGTRADMARWNNRNVTVIGEVQDVRPYLQQAAVFVAPVRLGGGIKGKILEAMASGVPVVATEETGRGIRCTPGTDIAVAADEADFARKTVELLDCREKRDLIAHNARKTVEEYYDWNKISAALDSFYASLL